MTGMQVCAIVLEISGAERKLGAGMAVKTGRACGAWPPASLGERLWLKALK
ncbi:MAG: hypothetical protein ONB56_20760 [candidate division KSB1 bacterium]|nr:hypothetical protein [candidate division KSB1 bacterium]MDZ7398258.1 hypothetical protein [candidate division KSB1 bacterium]MDZ7416992.1 hypothetical protein [candidate division KSB1 bacterium]